MNPSNPIVLKARPWPSIILLGFALVTLIVILTKNTGAWVVLGIILFVAALASCFTYSRITIHDTGLHLKNLFSEYKILWVSLQKTHVVYIKDGRASQYYWFFETTDQRKIKFSVQFYSPKSLKRLAMAIVQKSKSSIADDKIVAFAEDRYAWPFLPGI